MEIHQLRNENLGSDDFEVIARLTPTGMQPDEMLFTPINELLRSCNREVDCILNKMGVR